jgi:hypothetical protein
MTAAEAVVEDDKRRLADLDHKIDEARHHLEQQTRTEPEERHFADTGSESQARPMTPSARPADGGYRPAAGGT